MFFSHAPELIIVLIIALVVFGPKRLPELGSSLGKGIREFKKATNELQDSINVNHSEPLPPEQPTYSSEYAAPQAQRPAASADYVPAGQHPASSAEYTTPPTQSNPVVQPENKTPRN